jgi:ABC-2 type transport system permease protein
MTNAPNHAETSRLRGLWLVTVREMKVRGLSKSNVIGFFVTVGIVAVLAAIPALVGGDDAYEVGLAGDRADTMQAVLESGEAEFDITRFDGADDAEHAVAEGDVSAAVVDGVLYVDGSIGPNLYALLEAAHQAATVEAQLGEAGLDPAQVQEALTVAPLQEVTVGEDPYAGYNYFFGLFISLTLFVMLMTPVTYVAMGVVEEKSSRIVEILLTSLKPWQLLSGKVIGLGVVSAVNMVGVVATAVAVAAVTGLLPELPEGATGSLVSVLGWWLLAFALYGFLAGGAGALISRQEDMGAVTTPLTMLLMLSYFGTFVVLNAPESQATQVISLVPPFSAIAMPTRVAITHVPPWEVALAVGLLAAATIGALVLGSTIYKRSVMHTGSRLKLRDALNRAA